MVRSGARRLVAARHFDIPIIRVYIFSGPDGRSRSRRRPDAGNNMIFRSARLGEPANTLDAGGRLVGYVLLIDPDSDSATPARRRARPRGRAGAPAAYSGPQLKW